LKPWLGFGKKSQYFRGQARADHPVMKTRTGIDINTLTPLDALTALSELKKQLDEEDSSPAQKQSCSFICSLQDYVLVGAGGVEQIL
jgi:hypothetical protein